MSTAMTVPAPAMAAPWMALRPTPPQPMTATVVPGSTLAVLNTAPRPVMTPQPDQGGPVEGHLGADLHDGVLVDEHLLGEGRQVEELVHGRAIGPGQARRRSTGRGGLGALSHRSTGRPGEARLAVAAEHRQAGDDVVARADVGDLVADGLDDAGRLVAEHHGHRRAGTCPP